MVTFAYRVLPPPAEFWAGIEPGEVALMVRYLEHLQGLREHRTVRVTGHAANGGHSVILIEAPDRVRADAIARSDPAVAEGLMRLEPHTALTVFNGAAGAQGAERTVRHRDFCA